MIDVALIDHTARCQATWGVKIGPQHYRADVLVVPLAMTEPPAWMTFEMRPIPDPRIRLADWFMVGATPEVARYACELVSAELEPIKPEDYAALADAYKPCMPIDHPEPLAAADFAGPNRAQRRAQAKPKRRR
jgi:hypothetical protein